MKELAILLVEDSDDDRFLIGRALRNLSAKVRVETAEDGAEALDRLLGAGAAGKPLPDLVLLDLQMPRLNGLEVLERLRAVESTRKLPVLVLTASDYPNDVQRSRELGIAAYLNKLRDLGRLAEIFQSLGFLP